MELDDYITEEFNRACELLEKLCEGMHLSDDALRQYGSAVFSLDLMKSAPGLRSENEVQLESARLAALHASAPHAPTEAVDSVCTAYILLSLVHDPRFSEGRTALDQLKYVMDAFLHIGSALGHFCADADHVYAASKSPAKHLSAAGFMSEISKKALDVRHAENRSMKAELLQWYAQNRHTFPSKNAAAMAAIKLWPVAYSTIRDNWLKGV